MTYKRTNLSRLLYSNAYKQNLFFLKFIVLLLSFINLSLSNLYSNENCPLLHFKFNLDDPIDVIIPCTDKDLDTLDHCIEGIRTYGHNVRRIIVVSNRPLTDKAEWFNENHYPFSKFDVATELMRSADLAQEYVANKKNRIGWIYQQLLKFYAPFVIPDISSNVLLLDSDTVFIAPVQFTDKTGAGLFNVGNEYHPPYFKHAARLLDCLYKKYSKYSGICHHMLIQRPVLESLFREVEEKHAINFWQAFTRCIDPNDIFGSGASEYEIYFNYCLIRSRQFKIRKLKWKNVSSLNLHKYKKMNYSYVSCHAYMRE